jgi:crotonobetainyl-CoA:carnitine CoA-transferase CaiB-like acyl-CoA transferase
MHDRAIPTSPPCRPASPGADGMTARSDVLAGVRVVGLEHSVAGPLCTRILGDMGADVVKVERPGGGDFARHWDHNAGGESAQFWWLNRGKRSIALNLKDVADRATFDALLDTADVLVHNMSPAAAARLGLDDEAFDERFAHLVHCQISGYGATGPLRDRKAYDMLVQAESGIMSVTGRPEQPTRVGVSVCDIGTGIYASALILGALVDQRATGRGRRIDVAMLDAAVEFAAPMLLSYANAGVTYERIPQRHHAIAPYGVFECAGGGAILIAIEQDAEWRLLCERLLGDPALGDDPRFITNSSRIEHRELVDGLVADALGRIDVDEAVALCEELGLAYGVLNEMSGVRDHPVVADRGILATETSAAGVPVQTLVGLAERQFATARAVGRPPSLDEHRQAIIDELDTDLEGNPVA